MRAEEPLNFYGKLHTEARVCRKQFLPYRNVEHTVKDPQFLMHCCGLEPAAMNDATGRSDLNSILVAKRCTLSTAEGPKN